MRPFMLLRRIPVLIPVLLLPLILLLLAGPPGCSGDGDRTEVSYYGIEIGGTPCGYARVEISPLETGREEKAGAAAAGAGKPGPGAGDAETTIAGEMPSGTLLRLEESIFMKVSALGCKFDSKVRLTYHVDPATGRFTYHESHVDQGQMQLDSRVVIDGDSARCTSSLEPGETVVELPDDVVLENTITFEHLKRDFVDGGLVEKTYSAFEVRDQQVQPIVYTKAGTDTLEVAGHKRAAIVLDRLSRTTGAKQTFWIDTETGRILRLMIPGERLVYLSDRSVVKKVRTADLNETIVTKTNVMIADVPGISYLKIKAVVEPSGLWVTQEGLNVPGQSFAGAIDENLIEGIFEIEHPRYDGRSAPPFPPDFAERDLEASHGLREYLEPSALIESDDPVLVAKAQEITEGARDAWDAACRLSAWVADNIGYAIPGGVSARKTYDIRAGECGAHSLLLAAFCRAVGIPARMVWGCMYMPSEGGAFGQHGWNEIYMGQAGWIPVDATAGEIDFVDSGHIRIGEYESLTTALNAKAFEILDYRIGAGPVAGAQAKGTRAEAAPDGGARTSGAPGETAESAQVALDVPAVAAKYEPYLGEYTNRKTRKVFKVLSRDGCLVIDIPGQTVLAFADPDERGRWYCKLARHVYCEFEQDSEGRPSQLLLHELVKMPRKSDPETVPDMTPPELRPYLGTYLFPACNADFTVLYKDGSLAVHDSLEKTTVKLRPPDADGGWLDEYGKNTISFERDADGRVQSLTIDATNLFHR